MSTSTPSGIPDSYAAMRHLHPSPAEKAVARKAFESALKREFEAVITETRQMAAAITQSDDLWELEDHLTPTSQENRPRIRLSILRAA
jgi:hypothetical protein